MVRMIFTPLLLFFAVLSVTGCGSIMPERKESTAKRQIYEEDIGSGSRSMSTPEEGAQTQTAPVDPPAAYGGQAEPQTQPQPIEPGARSPRRYIWRDKGGGERSWDAAPRGDTESR